MTGDAKIIGKTSETIIGPKNFSLHALNPDAIKGGATVEAAAQLFHDIISGNGTEAQNQVVCANAAVAISTVENNSLAEAYYKAEESLKSGKALEKLKKLQHLSR
ncbi:Anthranilate phosphoribosyltransferase [compost metagenome]